VEKMQGKRFEHQNTGKKYAFSPVDKKDNFIRNLLF